LDYEVFQTAKKEEGKGSTKKHGGSDAMKRTLDIRNAYKALEDAYEYERQLRASIAWKNGVKWVIYQLQDGVSLKDVISSAKDRDVEL
jgi:hypothetical protein